MRKAILILMLLLSLSCLSQNKQILYNFTSVPQSLMTNPGSDFKYKAYFGVPFLSGISANVGSTGFSAYDLFANDGIDFNDKLRNVVYSSSRNDKLALNEQVELFNGGFKLGGWRGNSYISFGMYQELDVLSYMPKDPAILFLDGNQDYIGKSFNFGDLNVKGELLSVLHVGYHKNIKKNLTIGVRAKIYSSVFNVNSTKNSGYFYTIPSTNTVYEQVISSNALVNTSGLSNYTSNYSGNAQSDITKKMFFGGDLGLGFDAGLTYYPKKNIQFTASIVDVGFIKHSKDVSNYSYKGYYKYEGLTPSFTSGGTPRNVYQEFLDAIPFDTLHTKYTTWRPAKFNASYQYSFGVDRGADCNCSGSDSGYTSAVGAQLFAMTTPRMPFLALTAYYRRRIFDALQMKATYTVDSFSYTNIGLGLSTTIAKVNFYVLADNLLEYRDLSKARSLSFQLGLNVIFADSSDPY